MDLRRDGRHAVAVAIEEIGGNTAILNPASLKGRGLCRPSCRCITTSLARSSGGNHLKVQNNDLDPAVGLPHRQDATMRQIGPPQEP